VLSAAIAGFAVMVRSPVDRAGIFGDMGAVARAVN
jgi:hypothetical protein